MSGLIRLPERGPVSVSTDRGGLVITIPPGSGMVGIHRVDILVRKYAEGSICFYFETAEAPFVADQIEARTWDRLKFVNKVSEQCLHTFDLPGPFSIAVGARNAWGMSLKVDRVKRKR